MTYSRNWTRWILLTMLLALSSSLAPNGLSARAAGKTPFADGNIVLGSSFIDPSASVSGNLLVAEQDYIAPSAHIRTAGAYHVELSSTDGLLDNVQVLATGQNVLIGECTTLASGAAVTNSTLASGVYVGLNARVENSVLEDGVLLEPGAQVVGLIVPKGRVVPAGVLLAYPGQIQALKPVSAQQKAMMDAAATANRDLAAAYAQMLTDLGPASIQGTGPSPKTPWNPAYLPPTLAKGVVIARDARLIGAIQIGKDSTVASFASLRADEGLPIVIGEGAQIGKQVTFHAAQRKTIGIGSGLVAGSQSIFFGPLTVGNRVSVGARAVLSGATLGSQITIGAGALVIGVRLADGARVPDGAVVVDQAVADKFAPKNAALTSVTAPSAPAPAALPAPTQPSPTQALSTAAPAAGVAPAVPGASAPVPAGLPLWVVIAGVALLALLAIGIALWIAAGRKRSPAGAGVRLSLFGRWKVGARIISGFLIALALMGVVGALAIDRLQQLNTTVTYFSRDLSVDRQLANDTGEAVEIARFYAAKYMVSSDPRILDRFTQEAATLDGLFKQADVLITEPDRIALFKSIQTAFTSYRSGVDAVRQTMADRQQTASLLEAQAVLGETKLQKIRADVYALGDLPALQSAGEAQIAFNLMRLDASAYLQDGDPQALDRFDQHSQQLKAARASLSSRLDKAEDSTFAQAITAIDAYSAAFQALKANTLKQSDLQSSQLDVLGPQMQDHAAQVVKIIGDEFDRRSRETDGLVAETRWVLIGAMLIAAVLVLGLGLAISRGITRPLEEVTRVARQIADIDLPALNTEMDALAQGDLTRSLQVTAKEITLRSRDEIGQLGQAFNGMIDRLNEAGESFGGMVSSLHQLIGQVAGNAENVSAASLLLTETAGQAGRATGQIAVTIQQVARGNIQQTESVNRTVSSVGQMAQVMEGVAKGAQEQSRSVERAAAMTAQISDSIRAVAGHAQEVSRDSEAAASAAREGAKTVLQTVQGMQTIKSKVGLSAQRVQEMGARSEQIGAIVETIEEIAAQTNLLALNAAIEAARAGEQGKGFAVVADEVRKLAERAGKATKEIGGLIRGIQNTVSEAVVAMRESAQEVESGMQQANGAGLALEQILKAAEAVSLQAGQATRAAEKMSTAAGELVGAVESVSAVVEENTAASQEMAANSREVMQAIENIAAVSAENGAAVEEVSAGAAEMNNQVTAVTDSARSLAGMAEELQQLVAQFTLLSEERAPDRPSASLVLPDPRRAGSLLAAAPVWPVLPAGGSSGEGRLKGQPGSLKKA
jgi:methyl-accepting chemotaxis protein